MNALCHRASFRSSCSYMSLFNMKTFALIILIIGSVSSQRPKPYLPRGWWPKGAPFLYPTETVATSTPEETPETESSFLRQYGPAEHLDITHAVTRQSLPDVITEHTFKHTPTRTTYDEQEFTETANTKSRGTTSEDDYDFNESTAATGTGDTDTTTQSHQTTIDEDELTTKCNIRTTKALVREVLTTKKLTTTTESEDETEQHIESETSEKTSETDDVDDDVTSPETSEQDITQEGDVRHDHSETPTTEIKDEYEETTFRYYKRFKNEDEMEEDANKYSYKLVAADDSSENDFVGFKEFEPPKFQSLQRYEMEPNEVRIRRFSSKFVTVKI